MLHAHLKKDLPHFELEIDIEIHNQILVLWGSSGAGKTTVLNCLAGLINPTEGSIQLNGRHLFSSQDKINLAARQRRIGYVFQDYALFPHQTVIQNVCYGLKSHCDLQGSVVSPRQLLQSFGISHLHDRYPRQLSGGEKQRVALARALVVQPELLLLDEPFNSLDYENKVSLRQELRRLYLDWQIPFIMVTHDREDALYWGDKIMHINHGKVINIECDQVNSI